MTQNPLLSFAQVQKITQGRWLQAPLAPEQTLVGAAFDSRSPGEAEIFFTFASEKVNGHQFLDKLQGSRIKLVVVTEEVATLPGVAVLLVKDSLQALQDCARWLAKEFQGKIVNLTGSSGKTTLKTWLAHLAAPYWKIATNQKSFNNHLGCPVTILSLQADTDLLILEMGTNGFGELSLLSQIAPADLTLLLNVGHAHVGKFGGLEGTYRAKLEIFEHQRAGGLSLIPFGDAKIEQATRNLPRLSFGEAGADCAVQVVAEPPLAQVVEVNCQGQRLRFEVNQVGTYVGKSLAAVLLILQKLGLDLAKLPEKLALPQEKGRSTIVEGRQGTTLLNDCYNANPESVVNMLQTLVRLPGQRHVALIGNLGELEEDLAESAKVIVAGVPASLGHLFLSGATGRILAPLLQQAHPGLEVRFFEHPLEMLPALESWLGQGLVVGVKGSRSSHMERLIYALQGKPVVCAKLSCGLLQLCEGCPEL